MAGNMAKDISSKCAEIRSLVEERRYREAYEILEDLDVDRVKSIMDLNAFSEVYRKMEDYEKSMDMLVRVYDKAPTKRVIYKLVCLAVKSGNFDEAEEYYQEYVDMDPDSVERYILRYRIDKAHGAGYQARIDSLEKLKTIEYIEEWAYELAKLYHKAGMKINCVRECSDIILWFGHGTIVEKAKLLKDYYEKGAQVLEKVGVDEEKLSAAKRETDPNDLVMDTKELSSQVIEIAEQEHMEAVKKELVQDLLPTQNIQEAIREDLSRMDVSDWTKPDMKAIYDEALSGLFEKEDVEKKEEPEITGDDLECIQELKNYFADQMQDIEGERRFLKLAKHIQDSKEFQIHYAVISEGEEAIPFCKNLARYLHAKGVISSQKVAKITAEKLNRMDLEAKQEQLKDCTLIIEDAGSLYIPTVKTLMNMMDYFEKNIVVIFLDKQEAIQILLEENFLLRHYVGEQITLQ